MLVLAAIIAGIYYLPSFGIWWLDILWRGGLLSILVASYVWFREPSKEVKGIMKTILSKVNKTSPLEDLDADF